MLLCRNSREFTRPVESDVRLFVGTHPAVLRARSESVVVADAASDCAQFRNCVTV